MANPASIVNRSPPLASRVRLYAGVFLIFGTLGLLFDIAMSAARPAYGVVLMVVMTGLIAVGWCHAFQTTFRWLILVVPFSVLAPMSVDILLPEQSVAWQVRHGISPRHAANAASAGSMFVIGYVLIVTFIRDESRRHERLAAEVAVAKRIHDSLVAPQDFRTPFVEVCGRSVAGQEMGGDLLDAVREGDAATVFVADVSGHGVAAGLVMAMVKSAIRMRLRQGGELGAMTRDLNEVLCDLTRTEDFVTFSCIRFDASGRAVYCLAGHLSILCYRRGTGEIEELPNDHLPLGILPGEDYAAAETACSPGDVFIMLTDGYVEALNARDEQFGEARIRELLAANGRRAPADIYEAITAAVRAHGPAGDDQTLVVMRVV